MLTIKHIADTRLNRILVVIGFLLLSIIQSLGATQQTLHELSVSEVEPGVFVHKSYKLVEGYGWVSSNGLVVIEADQAFIIDTPWTNHDTNLLIKWIEKKQAKIVGSLSTHSHDDRAGGIQTLNSLNIPTFALHRTNQILKARNKPVATTTFSENRKLFMNGKIEAFYPGGGHTEDNIVVWLKPSQLLFGGCFIRSIESNSLGYIGEAKVQEWSESINKLLSQFPTADIVIPGHGKPGKLNLLEHTKALVAEYLAVENQ